MEEGFREERQESWDSRPQREGLTQWGALNTLLTGTKIKGHSALPQGQPQAQQ